MTVTAINVGTDAECANVTLQVHVILSRAIKEADDVVVGNITMGDAAFMSMSNLKFFFQI